MGMFGLGASAFAASIVSLDSSLFESGDTSAAFLIWQHMQTFANIIIIIILLVIIFSQLTGIGIDNYGIKKMLPKLIVMALMINLSFVLCQLAVDVSNIVGKGARDLLLGVSQNVTDTLKANGTITWTDGVEVGFGYLFTALLGMAAGATVALPIVIEGIMLGAVFWWVPLLFAALIALISVIVFFLLLAARQLLAVILVAISPLALVCYVLPNTRSISKKWLDVFKTILIVYPICGALSGVSRLMKVIAFNADGIHIGMVIVAMLSTFIPFIIAPMLIKKSISALGEFGNMVSHMGDRLKNGVRSANNLVRGSAMYKDAQRTSSLQRAESSNRKFEAAKRRAAELREKARSGTPLDRNERNELRRAERRVNSLFRQRQYAMNAQTLDRGATEDVETARTMIRGETGNYDTNIMGTQLNDLLQRVDDGETLSKSDRDRAFALASQLSTQTGGAKKIYEALSSHGGAAAQMMGEYMATNSKVRQALEGKSQRTASRVADIASGAIDRNTTQAQYDAMNNQYLAYRRQQVALGQQAVSEAEWRNKVMHDRYLDYQRQQVASGQQALDEATWRNNEERAGRGIDDTTVVQNIARNVLDKDKDFVTQSGAEVAELVNHISQERIDRMAANATLFGYGDVAEGVRNTILGMASRGGDGGTGGSGGGGADYDDFGGAGADIPRGDAGMDTDSILDWNLRDDNTPPSGGAS